MFLIAIGRIFHFVLLLLILKLSTYLLSPAEIGRISLIASVAALITLFFITPIGMYIGRHFYQWNNQEVISSFLIYYWLYLFIIAILSGLLLGFFNYFHLLPMHVNTMFLIFFIIATIFFGTLNQTVIPFLNLLNHRLLYILFTIGTSLVGIVFAYAMVEMFGKTAESWMLGLLLGQVLFAIIGTREFYKAISSSFFIYNPIHPQLIGCINVFHFCWPIAISVGLNWVQSQSYRFFIEHSLGFDTLGFFVAGYGISSGIVSAFESIFTTYLQPYFYKKLTNTSINNQITVWGEYASIMMPTLILLLSVIVILSSELTSLFLAYGYEKSAIFVILGACIESLRVFLNIYSTIVYAKKNTKLLILPNLIGSILLWFLIYWLTPKLGIMGISLSLLSANMLNLFIFHFILKCKYNLSLPNKELIKACIFATFICILHVILKKLIILDRVIFSNLLLLLIIGLCTLLATYLLLKDQYYLDK